MLYRAWCPGKYHRELNICEKRTRRCVLLVVYVLYYLVVVGLIGKPRCHMSAICEAFILGDFCGGIPSEKRVRQFRQKIEQKKIIGTFVRIDIFGSHMNSFPPFSAGSLL